MIIVDRARRVYEAVNDKKLALGVSASLLLADIFVPSQAMMVYADDRFTVQAGKALQSALATPEVTGNMPIDTAFQVITAGVSAEFARRTISGRRLGEMAVASQLLSCAVNAGVERTGWLTPIERAQPDVGFSAISVAWFTNALLHRVDRAKSVRERRLWQTGTVAFIGAMTVGAYLVDSLGGKLDITSHSAGIAAGAGAYYLDKRQQDQQNIAA